MNDLDQPSAPDLQAAEAIRRDLEDLEGQRRDLLAEVANLRRMHRELTEEVAAAEARNARVAELTLEARERRYALAGEVIALCSERAELVERISALRIAAMKLEAGQAVVVPPRTVAAGPVAALVPVAQPLPLPPPPPPPLSPPPVPLPPEPRVAAVNSVSRGVLVAASGRRVATWSVQARTTVKPRNDSYDTGAKMIWRRSEDRFRVSAGEGGVLAAVSDGAGASGLYCGNWAEALVERLSPTPLVSIDDLNTWLDGFCLEFRQTQIARCKSDPPKHSKFVREGSFATLTACWLRAGDQGVTAHWLGYGDSPLVVFDRVSGGQVTAEARVLAAHPATLAAFDRDPYLLNWKAVPEARHLSIGTVALPACATVVLASDGIGQYLMLRHLAAAGVAAGADGGALTEEFRRLIAGGVGRLAATAKAHAARPGAGVAELRGCLNSDQAFATMVADRCEDGLLANDDSTVIMIDVDHDCA